ncbi:hypothetical protein SBV1_2680005 [Verrucomicrobia bacterium]|nr:hypothetical protein SBV1_2680005 [Verrucomicrobiota bacterium]
MELKTKSPGETNGVAQSPFVTAAYVANRWGMHVNSIWRMIREKRIASVVIGRRKLIPSEEIARIESNGFVASTTP